MARLLICCLLAAFTVVTYCAKTNVDPKKDEKSEAPALKMDKDMKDQETSIDSRDSRTDYDLIGAMNDCNETFRVEMCKFMVIN